MKTVEIKQAEPPFHVIVAVIGESSWEKLRYPKDDCQCQGTGRAGRNTVY